MVGISIFFSGRAMINDELTLCGAPVIEPGAVVVNGSAVVMSVFFILLLLALCELSICVAMLSIFLFFN
jgi:hypothetical protein